MLSDFVCYIPLPSFVEGPEQHRWPQGSMYTIYQVQNTLFRWQLKTYSIWWFQAKQSEIITVCMPCTYIIYDSFNVTETSYVHNANRTLVDQTKFIYYGESSWCNFSGHTQRSGCQYILIGMHINVPFLVLRPYNSFRSSEDWCANTFLQTDCCCITPQK